MNWFRLIKLLTLSPFLVQAIFLFTLIFVSNESNCSLFHLAIDDGIVQIIVLFTYCFPILIGMGGLVYFSMGFFELEQRGVWVRTYLILSAINFLSFIWSYALLVLVFIFVPCFTFGLPL